MTTKSAPTPSAPTPSAPTPSAPTPSAWIESYYDQQPEEEWERLDDHRTEYTVTLRALLEHLPPPPARILDCGGGPGRYALALAERGYQVTLFDLSAQNLALARQRAAEAGLELAAYEHGTALDLSRFAAAQAGAGCGAAFDAVLLMGPLYHLLQEAERRQALREAYRVLVPGGPLFAAFVTRYAAARFCAAHALEYPLQEPVVWNTMLDTGVLMPRGEQASTFVAYGAHPTEVQPLLAETGFELVSLLGVEGLASMIEDNLNALTGPTWELWADLNCRVAADPSLHGAVEHLLAIAVKPRWRAVLRAIAGRLQSAGIPFEVVGGAAVALHGVPVAIHDLDLSLSVDDVYRFQALYADQATRPAALSEDEHYRSHFGRYEIDGLQVEVMGDLCWREEDRWVPISTRIETTVELEGVTYRVPSLEEETLAYIRRGRLERAALCLPHCDPKRLTQLLRGEQPTHAL